MTKTIEELEEDIRKFYRDGKQNRQNINDVSIDNFGPEIDFTNIFQNNCLLQMVINLNDQDILENIINFNKLTPNANIKDSLTSLFDNFFFKYTIIKDKLELAKKFVESIPEEEKHIKLHPSLKSAFNLAYNKEKNIPSYDMQNWLISLALNQETIDEMIHQNGNMSFVETAKDGNLEHLDKLIKLTPDHDMKLKMLTNAAAFKESSLIIRAKIAAELAEIGCEEELTKLIKKSNPSTDYQINSENPKFLIELGSSHQTLYKSNPKWDYDNIREIKKFVNIINPLILTCKNIYSSTNLVDETLKNILGNIRFYWNKNDNKGKDIELDSTQRLRIFDAARYQAERFKLPQSPENSKANNEISFYDRLTKTQKSRVQSR